MYDLNKILENLRTSAKLPAPPAQSLRYERNYEEISWFPGRERIKAKPVPKDDQRLFGDATIVGDVAPPEPMSFEEYLQQEDLEKPKRDFVESVYRMLQAESSKSGQVSSRPTSMELVPFSSKSDDKAAAYAAVLKDLTNARERGSPFKPATAFMSAYGNLRVDAVERSVSMQQIWQVVQALTDDDRNVSGDTPRKMSLALGARRHLECGHEKYVMETIQRRLGQVYVGGAVDKIRSFVQALPRDCGVVIDLNTTPHRRKPVVDTTWEQIYFCLRTGYYEQARELAVSSPVSQEFAPMLIEWISTKGMVTTDTAAAASEECEKLLRIDERGIRGSYDRQRLLLYAMVSGSRKLIYQLLREIPIRFDTIEDYLWFRLSAIHDYSDRSSSSILDDGLSPHTLEDLQADLNKFEPTHYTMNGKNPLMYPYVLLLSIQLLPAVMTLSKDFPREDYIIDAAHIVFADYGVLLEGATSRQDLGVMDAYAKASSIIEQFGSI